MKKHIVTAVVLMSALLIALPVTGMLGAGQGLGRPSPQAETGGSTARMAFVSDRIEPRGNALPGWSPEGERVASSPIATPISRLGPTGGSGRRKLVAASSQL